MIGAKKGIARGPAFSSDQTMCLSVSVIFAIPKIHQNNYTSLLEAGILMMMLALKYNGQKNSRENKKKRKKKGFNARNKVDE